MINIDKELVNWAVDTIQKKYSDDVSLLIGQMGACKIPTDEKNMVFDYYVPATERGFQLAETFIIEDMGYDLYPMTFERLEEIANLVEPRMIWVLEKSEVIYARNEKDRERFEQIKETLHSNLQNREKTITKTLEFMNIAMEVYNTMLFEENICKVRKAAGGVSSMLTYSLALLNGIALIDGYGNLVDEVNKLKVKPNTFSVLYLRMIGADTVEEIRDLCKKLIQSVRTLLQEIKNQMKQPEEKKDNINYEDLAYWYQEARYTFRKIAYYIGENDSPVCYSLGCYLQIEFDAIQDEFGLEDMDLLGVFDAKNLQKFWERVQQLESYLIDVIQTHKVVLNQYKSVEEFLQKHR